jgi:streptogramin lyase
VYGGLHPVAAAGLVWIPAAGTKALLGLDPMTLAVKTTVTVPARTGIATQGAGTVVVSDDHQVSFIRDGKVAHRLTVGPRISSIAMSADGTRLYVATQPGRSPGPGQIETLDPRTGARLAAPLDSGLAVIYGLRATAGGLWSTSLGGMHAVTGFQPYHARHPVSTYGVGMSGGGALTLPSISNGVAWLGSTDELGCADPDTGTVRARVPIGTKHGLTIAAISGLAVLNGKVYAAYNGINGGPANALIVMTPPAKCFGS